MSATAIAGADSAVDKLSPDPQSRARAHCPRLRRTTRLKWAKPFSWASARVRRTAPYEAASIGPEDHDGR